MDKLKGILIVLIAIVSIAATKQEEMKYNGWDAFAISEGYLRQSNPDIFLIEDGAKIYFKHKYARFRYKLDDTNNIAARYNWVNLKKKGRMTTGFEPKTISVPLQTGLVIRYNQH